MKNILFIAFISLSQFFSATTLIDKDEYVMKTMSFGKGSLQYSYAIAGLRSSNSFISYLDENNNLKWKKKLDFEGIPTLTAFSGLSESKNNESSCNVFIANEDSKYAYALKNYDSEKGDTPTNRIYKIDLSGNITSKDIQTNKIFSFINDDIFAKIYASFISNEKFYLVYELNNSKLKNEKKYYIVEIDENFNFKSKELDNSKIDNKEWEENKVSKIKCLSQDNQNFVYYKVAESKEGYKFEIMNFDFKSFSISKKHSITMPLDFNTSSLLFTEKRTSFYHYNLSSTDYEAGLYSRKSWKEERSTLGSSTILEKKLDLNSYFPFYKNGSKLTFYGEMLIKEQRGAFLLNIELDNNLEKTITPDFYNYSQLSNFELLIKNDEYIISQLEFNPKSNNLLIKTIIRNGFEDYTFKYYSLEKMKLTEVKNASNYFIPNPYLAIHQEYLETNGLYNFPEANAWTMTNHDYITINESKTKLYISYFHSKISFLTGKDSGEIKQFIINKK